MPMVARRS